MSKVWSRCQLWPVVKFHMATILCHRMYHLWPTRYVKYTPKKCNFRFYQQMAAVLCGRPPVAFSNQFLKVAIVNKIGSLQLLKRRSCFSHLPSPLIQIMLRITELQRDTEWRSRHQQLSLGNFIRQLDKGRFQEIRTFAKKMLSLFRST